MTCYFRHLKHIFERAGIEVTRDNRREIDRIISGLVNVDDRSCPKVWSEIKRRLAEDEEGFVSELTRALQPLRQTKGS